MRDGGSLPSVKKRILTSATGSVGIPDFIRMASPVRLNYLSSVIEKDAAELTASLVDYIKIKKADW